MNGFPSLDVRALDRARLSRDPRFDGKFFVAVTSTRIYCRPICPVREAKRSNVRYYFSAAAAAEAGFRPCLRCRPEAAPGTPAWLGTSAIVRRALRLIDDGVLDHGSVEDLATKLGVGSRHLHRLFVQHAGASPIVFAQTRRVHFAKRLLDETSLSITEIALAAGFGSLRRFNSVFKQIYKRAPRELRRQTKLVATEEDVVLRLAYRPPYDFAQVLDFLRARAIPSVEIVTDTTYKRSIRVGNGSALISIRCLECADALELRVRGGETSDLFSIVSTVRRVFDLAADPARTMVALRNDPLLGPLVNSSPGLRIPGAWDPFECAVRAIVGQQVSVRGAGTLVARLVERIGERISEPVNDRISRVFPTPADIVNANLRGLGLTTARVRALHALAQGVLDQRVDFNGGLEDAIDAVTDIEGIGPWTAQYIALRGLGDPDAFPCSDLVLRRMASSAKALTPRELETMAEAWRPWRAYAAMHLWHGAARQRRRAS